MCLPRYWPQWNPIELVWNWMKDFLSQQLSALRNNPAAAVTDAMNTVTAELAKSFIRHSQVYPQELYN